MSLTNHGKKTKRLYIFQILWGNLRAFLFCFQDRFKVFHSSTCLHVSLHTPLGNPTPVLAPIMGHKHFPAGCGLGSPHQIQFSWRSPSSEANLCLSIIFQCPMGYTHTHTHTHTHAQIQRVKAKSKQKHFPQCNYNPFL